MVESKYLKTQMLGVVMIRFKARMFYIFPLLILMHQQSALASQNQRKSLLYKAKTDKPNSFPGEDPFQKFKARKISYSFGPNNLDSSFFSQPIEEILPAGARWSDEPWDLDECENKQELKKDSTVQFGVNHLAPVPLEIVFKDMQKVQVNYPSCRQLRSDLINILIYKMSNSSMPDFSADLFYVPEIFQSELTGRKFLLFACAKKLVAENIHGVEAVFTNGSRLLLEFDSQKKLWNCMLQDKA